MSICRLSIPSSAPPDHDYLEPMKPIADTPQGDRPRPSDACDAGVACNMNKTTILAARFDMLVVRSRQPPLRTGSPEVYPRALAETRQAHRIEQIDRVAVSPKRVQSTRSCVVLRRFGGRSRLRSPLDVGVLHSLHSGNLHGLPRCPRDVDHLEVSQLVNVQVVQMGTQLIVHKCLHSPPRDLLAEMFQRTGQCCGIGFRHLASLRRSV